MEYDETKAIESQKNWQTIIKAKKKSQHNKWNLTMTLEQITKTKIQNRNGSDYSRIYENFS